MRKPTVTIPNLLANGLLDEAIKFAPLETGGVILGRFDRALQELLVTELIGAGPGAERESCRFVPDGPWQRGQIAVRYEESDRCLEYLGDWHSHPTGNGPSSLDRITARQISDTVSARCPRPLFLIAAHERAWELRAYQWVRWHFRQLDVRVDEDSS